MKTFLVLFACFFFLGSMTPHRNGGRSFNPQNIQTFQGEVISIQRFSFANRPASHIQLILRTDKRAYPVEIGPSWYLEAQGVSVYPGDLLTIKGSIVKMNGKEVILTESLQKGGRTLQIRDSQGNPLWNHNPLFTKIRHTS
ncbi:MAG: hypothetical protein K940chlam9_00781 [Chlamydiae bacterium]|nr:hypothetical protein [Chlamydiota bacterium]